MCVCSMDKKIISNKHWKIYNLSNNLEKFVEHIKTTKTYK